MSRAAVLSAPAAVIILAALALPAFAQEPVHVLDRPKPEFDPVGGRVGSFFIYPKAELETRYESNVFATENNVEDDFIGVFNPQVSILSDWSRHALRAEAGAEVGRYAEFTDESYEDFFLRSDGRLDVLRSTRLTADVDLARRHEDRSSPDDVNGESPTEYYDLAGGVGASYQRSAILLSGDARVRYLDFQDVDSGTGGTINNDDRDRNIATAGGRVGYEIVPGYLAFIGGEYNNRNYISDLDDNGLDRDSQGYNLQAGAQFRLSGITRGEIGVGWQEQFYADSTLNDISGFSFSLGLTWFATELTTVEVFGSRSIEETTLQGASGYINSQLRVEVAHELLRNVILTGSLGGANNDYQGIDRSDYLLNASLGSRYLLNRNFYVGAQYNYRMREATSSSGSDFQRHIVMLLGGVQF